MPKRGATPEAKAAAMSAMLRSAGVSGVPSWNAVAAETGRTRETLKRWWASAKEGNAAAAPVHSLPAPPEHGGLDPRECSVVDYWSFAWGQLQSELGHCTSDTARLGLLKRQDEVFSALRAAMEEERAHVPQSREEIEAKLVADARRMPPMLAQAVLVEFRRRGLG